MKSDRAVAITAELRISLYTGHVIGIHCDESAGSIQVAGSRRVWHLLAAFRSRPRKFLEELVQRLQIRVASPLRFDLVFNGICVGQIATAQSGGIWSRILKIPGLQLHLLDVLRAFLRRPRALA